jgi:hypothetical protein
VLSPSSSDWQLKYHLRFFEKPIHSYLRILSSAVNAKIDFLENQPTEIRGRFLITSTAGR